MKIKFEYQNDLVVPQINYSRPSTDIQEIVVSTDIRLTQTDKEPPKKYMETLELRKIPGLGTCFETSDVMSQMSENERIRRRFTEVYPDLNLAYKMKYSKSY